jgi:small basic protein
MRLPSQDSSTGRAIKTMAQAIVGFIIGLVVVVWNVPGVPDAIKAYTQVHLVDALLTIGVPIAVSTGAFAFVWNLFRKNVPNY